MEKSDNKIIVKKPNFFIYTVPATIMKAFAKLYWKLKIDNTAIKGLQEPIVALSPHSSTMDILPVVATLLPKRYNVVAGRDLYTWKQLHPFMKLFGVIPKDQLSMDIQCMRVLKAAIEQKRNILIYPEGRTTFDGKELYYLSPSVGKFLKFLDSTVVVVKPHGIYLTKPRFSKGFRRGRMETKAEVLFTKEEVRSLSVKELTEKVREAFRFNDNIWQQENHVFFKSKDLTENFGYILYKCPKCGTEYTTTADHGIITCSECGNRVEYTGYGELIPSEGSIAFDRIDQWVDYERASVKEEMKDENFSLSKPVTAYLRNDETHKYDVTGQGMLTLNKDFIRYFDNNGTDVYEFSLTNVTTIISKNEEGIDLIIDNKTRRFLFNEHKWAIKYVLAVERAYINRYHPEGIFG